MISGHDYHQCGDEKFAAFLHDSIEAHFNTTLKAVEIEQPVNPVVRALEIIAGALGIIGLFKFIRKHFCSLRRRVERLADREERRAARSYRRAARKEAIRRRWQGVKSIFCRISWNGDYEEKRALILEESSTEDLGSTAGPSSAAQQMTEDGPTRLMYAQQIAAMLMRGGASSSTLVLNRPQDDADVRSDTRSRSSTLPSYESEQLPEYSSEPDMDHSPVADGFSPRQYTPSVSSNGTTVATPDTSLPDLSPRCSQDTLRTGDESD